MSLAWNSPQLRWKRTHRIIDPTPKMHPSESLRALSNHPTAFGGDNSPGNLFQWLNSQEKGAEIPVLVPVPQTHPYAPHLFPKSLHCATHLFPKSICVSVPALQDPFLSPSRVPQTHFCPPNPFLCLSLISKSIPVSVSVLQIHSCAPPVPQIHSCCSPSSVP